MQRASPLNSGRDRATLSRPCCPLLHPAFSSCGYCLVAPSLVFFLASPVRLFTSISSWVFAYGGRVIMVLYALLDPPSSFLLAKTNLPPPSSRLSLSRLALSYPPRRSFFVRFIRAKRSPRPVETLLLLGL